jgi:hypothetical protein
VSALPSFLAGAVRSISPSASFLAETDQLRAGLLASLASDLGLPPERLAAVLRDVMVVGLTVLGRRLGATPGELDRAALAFGLLAVPPWADP